MVATEVLSAANSMSTVLLAALTPYLMLEEGGLGPALNAQKILSPPVGAVAQNHISINCVL